MDRAAIVAFDPKARGAAAGAAGLLGPRELLIGADAVLLELGPDDAPKLVIGPRPAVSKIFHERLALGPDINDRSGIAFSRRAGRKREN